ncbi:MAG: metallophosphoesterase [Candidatus Thorarchaeota archaeon]
MAANRFEKYMWEYTFKVVIVADLHLNGTPWIIDEEEVNFRDFCHQIVRPLTRATFIIFLGDTVDQIGANDFHQAQRQLHLLYKTLAIHEVLYKTIFVQGNHDPNSRFFLWHKRIHVHPVLRIPLPEYRSLWLFHGDNTGLDQLMKKRYRQNKLKAVDVEEWRAKLRSPIDPRTQPWLKDYVVAGHTHFGVCNRKTYTLFVPSARKHWESSSRTDHGWVGFLGYGTSDHPAKELIAIENPLGQV